MYVEIKNNELLSWCKNAYLDYEFVDIDYSTFDPNKYRVIEGILKDISTTPDYMTSQQSKEKEVLKVELKEQIDEIDKKRIRAMCEPSIKDESTGQTWLEYYNLQVQELREKLNSIS